MTSLRFMLDGKRLKADDTPLTLGLKDNDQIEVTQPSGTPGSAAKDDALITIRVKDRATGALASVNMKRSTQMGELFADYSAHRGTMLAFDRTSVIHICAM